MHAATPSRAVMLALSYSVMLALAAPASAEPARADQRLVAQLVGPLVNHRTADPSETERQYNDVRASRLIGMFVRNSANEKLGQIKDLIVDLGSSRVHYAVLEFAGDVFVSKKLFVYPLTAFKPSGDGEFMVLAVDKGKLSAAPAFSSDQWPNWHARSKEIDQYFGITPSSDAGTSRRLVRASSYLGADVRDTQGKDVGDLSELVVNVNNGTVRYAVVAFDKPWSMDERLVAVPLKAFVVNDQGQLRVNVSREAIANAPGIDRRDWPKANLSQNAWISEVDRYAMSLTMPAGTSNRGTRSEAQGPRQ
ncbi:MAG: PRC-barrel domain-containing protein [Burkholderiales bacterium]|nr:PRC-barrel domain-containing protein [Burkholderiales bacterium]